MKTRALGNLYNKVIDSFILTSSKLVSKCHNESKYLLYQLVPD